MEKLFAGAAAAIVLASAVPAWAASPDAPPTAPEPAAQTIVAQAHLVFANAPGTPVVSDLTVVQQGGDFAIVRTSFSGTAAQPPAPVAAHPPATDRATRNTKG
jgi:hypothetical protein